MELRSLFLLNPEITFLNFGSFGACPKPVFERYGTYQCDLERDPVQFITITGPQLLKKSREALGAYIGCHADDLVYVPNPTYAINCVAKSLQMGRGDEILSTDLEYGAMDRTWKYYAEKNGAVYVRQPISLPLVSKELFLEEFWKGYTERTKVVFISQITSTTGVILPVGEICREAKKRGLLTIVDGAHVPGHIPLNLKELEADIYTGACHKWMLTPKGSSFLYVKPEFQPWMDPLVVSWGYDSVSPSSSQFLDYHEFNGTRDFSAYLTIPDAIDFMECYQWREVASDCRKLAQENYPRFCELLETEPVAPVTSEFIAQLCSIPVKTGNPAALKQHLFDDFRIEIPVMVHDDKIMLRYSVNGFNDQGDLDRLFQALAEIKKSGVFLK